MEGKEARKIRKWKNEYIRRRRKRRRRGKNTRIERGGGGGGGGGMERHERWRVEVRWCEGGCGGEG